MTLLTLLSKPVRDVSITIALLLTATAMTAWLLLQQDIGAQANVTTDIAGDTTKQTSSNLVKSEGVLWHGAKAWIDLDYDGRKTGFPNQEIKIGVIDKGFEGFRAIAGTEVPPLNEVEKRCYTSHNINTFTSTIANCQRDTNHGTAVTEIIHEMAPKAKIYIANPQNADQLRNAVIWMDQQGVDVINESLSWGYLAPGDGSYVVAPGDANPLEAVDLAVNGGTTTDLDKSQVTLDGGALWVNSGGNQAQRTWTGPFKDNHGNNNTHEFSGRDESNDVYLKPGQILDVNLRWKDQWGYPGNTNRNNPGASCDLKLNLYRSTGTHMNQVPDSQIEVNMISNRTQNGGPEDVPYEVISYTIPKPSATPAIPATPAPYHIYITRKSTSPCSTTTPQTTPQPAWLQMNATVNLQHTSAQHHMSLPAESDNRDMLAVGAVEATPQTVSQISSRGPDLHNYPNGRTKPNLVGIHCELTKSNPNDNTISANGAVFCGTSAAAPHVAGLAALVLGRDPNTYVNNPMALADYLERNAIQHSTPNPNNDWGYGFAYLPHPRGHASFDSIPSVAYIGEPVSFKTITNIGDIPGVIIRVSPGSLSLSGNCATNSTTGRHNTSVEIWGCSQTSNAKIWIYDGNSLLRTYSVEVKPLPTARINPRTTSLNQGTTKTLGLTTSNLAQGEQIQIRTNDKLSVQADCNAPNNREANVTKGNQFTLYACSPGPGTVTLLTAGGEVELNDYSITVNSATIIVPTPTPTPMPSSPNPPTNLRLSKVADNNQKLQLTYTHGGSPNRYQFQLYYLDKLTGNDQFFASENDSRSPETFSDVGRGYQYRARGRNCRTHSDRATCSAWSAWSNYVTLSNPQISITRLSSTIVNGKSDWFTVQGSDLTYDDPQTITLNSDHASIGFNKGCINSTSSSFTPIHDQWVGFHLYACDTPGGTITARLRDCNASGTVLDTATKSIKAIHDAKLDPEPKIFNINDLTRSTLLGTFSSTTPINITVSKTGDTGKLSLNAHCDSSLKTQGIYYKSAIHGDSVIAIKACRKGQVTIRLYERSLTGDLLKIYSLMVDDNATLTPEPSTIANGSAVTFTLGGTFSATQNITIRINRPGDDGRLSFTNTCNARTSTQVTRVKNGTITLKGCTAGPASIRLFKGRTLLKTYELTVE